MKKITLKNAPFSLALLSILFIPVTTQAIGLPGIDISHNGKIEVKGAEVVSVSGNTITGVIKLKNATTSATITIGTSTIVQTQGDDKINSSPYTLSSVKIGDVINVSGFFTGFTTSLNITADKIRNLSSYLPFRSTSGKIESINTANNSFTLKTKGNKLVTVTTTATTTVYLSNKATSTLATVLNVNKNVKVEGILNGDGTILAASSIRVNGSHKVKEGKQNNGQKEQKRFFGYWGDKDN